MPATATYMAKGHKIYRVYVPSHHSYLGQRHQDVFNHRIFLWSSNISVITLLQLAYSVFFDNALLTKSVKGYVTGKGHSDQVIHGLNVPYQCRGL